MRSPPHSSDRISDDDDGTIIEPIDAAGLRGMGPAESGPQGAAPGTRPVSVSPQPPPAPEHPRREEGELAYRPTIRPPVAKLTLLDDGEAADGESIRLRETTTIIGRSEGRVLLPHDPLVSARHAEIVREGSSSPYRWLLRDLGSSNGTFVRCSKTCLRPNRIIIVGSRRFVFRPALRAASASARAGSSTAENTLLDGSLEHEDFWPYLVETTALDGRLELPLRHPSLTLGQPGHGNDIELNDPTVARRHAQIVRDSQGEWHMEAKPSINGIWVQINAILLAKATRFQCGEQRFLFVTP